MHCDLTRKKGLARLAGVLGALGFHLAIVHSGLALTGDEILRNSDRVLNPDFDYSLKVKITTERPQRDHQVLHLLVLAKGNIKTLVETLAPKRERGRTLLFLGRDLWIYMPTMQQPFRFSPQLRLIGDVANGDIARANYSRDYESSLIREETRNGKAYYVLQLLAKSGEVPYSKVFYWVEKESFHPYRAEFYAYSGRVLKEAVYGDYQMMGGRLRPTRLLIKNPIVPGEQSVLEFTEMRTIKLPDKYFTKEYLKILKY